MTTFIPRNQVATGDTAVGNLRRFSFLSFDDLWIIEALQGLISDYSDPGSWYQVGTATPDDAAALFSKMWSTFGVDMATTGVIVAFGGGILPTGWIPCDGRDLLVTDYPNLFAAIGTTWGSSGSGHFNVPDLRGKTLLGQGTNPGTGTTFSLGTSGGEEAHVQTVSEMATHSHTDAGHTHSESVAAPNVTTIGAGAPEPTAVPAVGITGVGNASIQSTGSGNPANVMQPWAAVNYAIIS